MKSLLLLLLPSLAFACPLPDSLFEVMVGKWRGEGHKKSLVSGKVVPMKAVVQSVVENGKLISTNSITELGPTPKNYTKTYWVRASECQNENRLYLFGGVGKEVPSFTGLFNGEQLVTIQQIGDGIAYRLQTDFFDNRTLTTGDFILGEESIQKDEMTYTRLAD